MNLNVFVFSILTITYFLVIIFSYIKLKDIKNNPDKYEEEYLIDETNKKYSEKWGNYSRFFKSLSHQYAMVTFFFSLLIMIIGTLFILLINRLYAGANGYIFFGTQFAGASCFLFLGIPIGMGIIPLAIKKPFFVVSTLDLYNTDHRPKIYYKSYLTFLIIFIITFPFITLSCNNYGYYTSEGVYTNGYFQIVENYTAYEEIQEVEIYVSHDSDGDIDSLNYVLYLNNGEFNINSSNISKKTFSNSAIEIHQYLRELNQCEFIVTPLTEKDKEVYQAKMSEEEYIQLLEIFSVNENKT